MSSLTIGYDASSTLAPRTGIGRAALGLLRALCDEGTPAAAESGVRLRVWMNSLTRRPGPEHQFLAETPGVELIRSRRLGGRLVQAWARGGGPTAEDLLGTDVSVWHAPASYVPRAGKGRVPRIVTVYDVSFLEDPPHQRAPLGGGLFAEAFPRVLPGCARVVVPSAFTRTRVLEHYGLSEDQVSYVPLGIDPATFRVEAERFVEIARHDYGIPGEVYLLAVSDHQPRKRIGLLLDVYEQLRERRPETPPLVVLGWRGKPPAELKTRRSLYRHVHLLPHIPDGRLAAVYTGAVATILTSRHEGFGFPVLEAQACGSPVVCGRNSSLPEVGGDAAVLIDSDRPADWADAIEAIAYDQRAHDEVKERGLKNVSRFDWRVTAAAMMRLYREVAGKE